MRSASPVKSTSGGGFSFEDRVGAYLCIALLEGGPLLDSRLGPPSRIDFQVGADGWSLDDVLVTFASATATARWCVSIKDKAYLEASAPRELVTQIWAELTGESGSGFDVGSDLVGLVTAPLPGSVSADLQELIRLARHQDPTDLDRRSGRDGYLSQVRRGLWNSFRAPPTTSIPSSLSSSPGEALGRLRAMSLDFGSSPSRDEAYAVRRCADLLVDPTQGRDLWNDLVLLVGPERTAGGYFDLAKLHAALEGRHHLRTSNGHATEVRRLYERSMSRLVERWLAAGVGEGTADELAHDPTIGSVPCPSDSGLVGFVADFGSGKSVIAERFHQEDLRRYMADPSGPTPVYLRARNVLGALDGAIDVFATSAGLPRASSVRLVLDGLDEVGFGRGAELLTEARELARADERSRVILTARPGFSFRESEVHAVPPLTDQEVGELAERLGVQGFYRNGLPAPARESVDKPLFALIAIDLRRRAVELPSSRGLFIDALVTTALGGITAQVFEMTEQLASAASVSLRHGGYLTSAQLGGPDRVAELLGSHLVVQEGNRFRFALPVIEQFFAAHALLKGLVEPAGVVERLGHFEAWRYAYVIAVGIGTWEQASSLIETLGHQTPGAAAWVVREAISDRGPQADDAPSPHSAGLPSSIECAKRLRAAMQTWLGWTPELAPSTGLVGRDGRLFAVGAECNGRGVVAGIDVPNDEVDFFDFGVADPDHTPHRGLAHGPLRSVTRLGDEQAWPWRWTLDWAAVPVQRLLEARGLPLPDNQVFAREREWNLVRFIVDEGNNYRHKPIVPERVVDGVAQLLAIEGSDDPRSIFGLGMRGPTVTASELRAIQRVALERSEPFCRPWPTPDRPVCPGGMACTSYTPIQMAALVGGVYLAALDAYRELVTLWFPRWASTLGWASVMPVRLEIQLVEPTVTHPTPTYALHMDESSVASWDQYGVEVRTRERSERRDRWPDDEEMRAHRQRLAALHPDTWSWGRLGRSSTVDIQVIGNTPATDLAHKWLWRDLHHIGFIGDRPSIR